MEFITTMINDIGFPIFACLYLGAINQKILNTIDNRLDLIELRLEEMNKRLEKIERNESNVKEEKLVQ